MRIVYVPAGKSLSNAAGEYDDVRDYMRAAQRRWARSRTGARAMLDELLKRGLAERCEAWQFWAGPHSHYVEEGPLPIRLFSSRKGGVSEDLALHVRDNPPDLLWVEGFRRQPNLDQVLDACADSFKMIYTQYWKPWKVHRLGDYDLCLVDEDAHVRKVRKHYPGVRAAVWNKLIDHEAGHYPTGAEKRYDLCYVAFLRPRKNHELLFRAMARLKGRNLRSICVGPDSKGYQSELEQLASKLGVDVEFAGLLDKAQVNEAISQSRVGVMCSERDAAPRALLEYMAADVPVLVNSKLRAGTRYVGAEAGFVRDPEDFHLGIEEILDGYERFRPRGYFLARYSRDAVVERFLSVLEEAGVPIRAGAGRAS